MWTIFLGAEFHPEFGRGGERAHRAKAYEEGVVSYSVSAGATGRRWRPFVRFGIRTALNESGLVLVTLAPLLL